jgi:hypothetical protein
MLDRLYPRCNMKKPVLSILDERVIPVIRSYRFGIFRPRNFIEVSIRTLELFSNEHLEILFAHELCHFKRRDHLWYNIGMFFGRIALVGDSFISNYLDLYNMEGMVDEVACDCFGLNRNEFIRCLQIYKNVQDTCLIGQVEIFGCSLGLIGLNESRKDFENHRRLRSVNAGKIKLSWRMFLDQYTSAKAYWYPSIDDRISRLGSSRIVK